MGGVASNVEHIDIMDYVVLSLVMTACSGLSRRLCVVCVYGYGRVSICMAVGLSPRLYVIVVMLDGCI